MFSGRENPNVNMENLFFVQIFERKRRIVEQVKQQVDLYDQHLASKCLLAGVSPPPWLWSPPLPSQNSELNIEEIISGFLFPQSRPSISFLAGNVVRKDLTTVVEEQLLEEEQQHNVVRRVLNHSHEQDANIASPMDVHVEEGLVSTGIRDNQSCPSPKYSQNHRVDSIDLGCSQGKVGFSTTGCDRKPSSPGYCQDETLDPGLSLAKIQRSKSRQKAMELRSSAKALKSGSNKLKPFPGENIGLEIASLRSDSVSEIKHDENDDRSRDEVENSSSQGKGVDQCSTTESQKVESGDATASVIPESLLESVHVNEMDISQSIETIDEVSVKVDEQVDDPQSRIRKETAKWMTNEVSLVTDAGTSIFQSEQNRSKTKDAGSVESTSVDVEPIHSGSLLQGGHAKESLNPYGDIEGFVVTSDNQSEEKGDCADTNRCSSAGRVSQTGISTDSLPFSGGGNVRPPSSRFSKAKLSCNSSLTTLGPRLAEKEPRHNNIVSNMTSFVPFVQQQKPVYALITGKRDVKVKALEAAEASKRMAEQKENDRKMKKEAMKLDRARREQENLRKQEMEKKKKEEDRKKKEAEMAYKQEMEKKKKEEERKRKEFEMADRKRQREQEEKKFKEAKRQRIAEIQKQQREAEQKLQTEKELKRQAMDAKMKAQKELKGQSNAEKTIIGHANTKIPGALKSNSSDECNASRFSRDDDFKVLSNPGNMSEGIEKMEESYDISPYKCSDDEMEEEEDDNNKFVPTWARKSNVGLTVVSQLNIDPNIVFPKKSFPTIGQVLLPRRIQLRFSRAIET